MSDLSLTAPSRRNRDSRVSPSRYCNGKTPEISADSGSRGYSIFTRNDSAANPSSTGGIAKTTNVRVNSIHSKENDSGRLPDSTDSIQQAPPTARLEGRSESSSEVEFMC